jgi:hypothetical protein
VIHNEVWIPKAKFKKKNLCKNQHQKTDSAPSRDKDATGIWISEESQESSLQQGI